MKKLEYKLQMDSKKFNYLKSIGFDADTIYLLKDEIRKYAEKKALDKK